MKIGILTFHCAHNYGAVLQAYCLQEELKSYGHDVYIINYRPIYLTNSIFKYSIKCWISKSLKGLVTKWTNEPFLIKAHLKRYDGFEKFICSQLRLYTYNEADIEKNFDALIYGSDQIWNPEITGGKFDDVFFGINSTRRLISYAASSKFLLFNEGDIDYLKNALARYVSISVREEKLAEKLRVQTNLQIQTVLDPTLLCGHVVLEKISKSNNRNKPYIFIYELSHHKETIRIANSVARQMGFDIVELEGTFSARRLAQKDMSASPEDFVSYIVNAACVITTSFHGTALSLIFNKPFYAIRQNTSADGRIESILNAVGLLDRFIKTGEDVRFCKINYTIPNQKLEYLREQSKEFLRLALEKDE